MGEFNKFLEEITKKPVCGQVNRNGGNCNIGRMPQGANVEMGADLPLQNTKKFMTQNQHVG